MNTIVEMNRRVRGFYWSADVPLDMEFTVIQGDIADQSVGALVNAAGTSLRMESGVAGALRRAANGPINEEAMSKGPVDLGDVAVTDAYDLDAEYVVHAAAMPHYGDGRATAESIRDGDLDEDDYCPLEQAIEGEDGPSCSRGGS